MARIEINKKKLARDLVRNIVRGCKDSKDKRQCLMSASLAISPFEDKMCGRCSVVAKHMTKLLEKKFKGR